EQHLIPVEESTELLQIRGFIGKPAAATRTRGNQYFFINNRFIRNAYLNHAVVQAYEGLIDKESFPFYVLFFELDPQRVDVNVHPSKQEVKFDDDRILYAYLNAAVKHALARFNIAPALDFSLNADIQQLDAIRVLPNTETQSKVQSGFLHHSFSEGGKAHLLENQKSRADWQQQRTTFFPSMPEAQTPIEQPEPQEQPTLPVGEERAQQV